MRNKKALWIIETVLTIVLAVLALLLSKVVPCAALGGFKLNIFAADSLFNLILILCTYLCGMACAGAAAVIAPVVAAFFGVMPGGLPQMVPVLMAGDLAIVFITWLCFRASHGLGTVSARALNITGIVTGAILKAFTMWSLTEKAVIPMLHAQPVLGKSLTGAASMPQFAAALVGGAAALLILPVIRAAAKRR